MVYTRIKQKKRESIYKKNKVDQFGFTQWYSDEEKRDLLGIKTMSIDTSFIGRLKNITKKQLLMGIIIGGCIFIWLSMSIVSGIHSWKEFPANALWIKLMRTFIAVVFSPIYLFYIFLRIIVFKQYYNVK